MSWKALQDMSAGDIKRAVAEKYSRVATAPQEKFNFPVGRAFAEILPDTGECYLTTGLFPASL